MRYFILHLYQGQQEYRFCDGAGARDYYPTRLGLGTQKILVVIEIYNTTD